MQLYHLNSAYAHMSDIYGLEIDPDRFIASAMIAWNLIGNKHIKLHRFTTKTIDKKINLPCNVQEIEAVFASFEDGAFTSNKSIYNYNQTFIIENYIEARKWNTHPLYHRGALLNYELHDHTLYFKEEYPNVTVLYRAYQVDDEDELPMINWREMDAIATYAAYVTLYKQGLAVKDAASIQLAASLEQQWYKKCERARVSDHYTQNDLDRVLDVKTNWDRKRYGQSYKPLR